MFLTALMKNGGQWRRVHCDGETAQQAHKCKLGEDRSVRTGVDREDSGRGATRMSTFIVSKW